MSQPYNILILLITIAVFSQITSANEGAEGGKKEGEAATTATVEDKSQQERTKEWMDLGSQISSLKTKIKGKEESIKELIKEKKHAKDKTEAEHIVKNLISEHHELTQLEQEYNQKTQLMKYRYPDVGITEKRKYERIKIKSIDDYEEMMGIEGEVKKSVEKIKEHYGIEDEASNDKTQKNSDSHNPDDPNYLAQPIILKK